MNRYEILTGKEPPEEERVMGVDLGTGNSTTVVTTRSSDGSVLTEAELESLWDGIPDGPIDIPVQSPARFRVQNRNGDSFQVGDLVCADQDGTIKPCVPGGFEPIGAVVSTSQTNATADIQILTMEQHANQEATNQTIARRHQRVQQQRVLEQADAEEAEQRARVDELARVDVLAGMARSIAPSMDYHFQEYPPAEGVSGASENRPSHTGNLHEHPQMQQRLKVPNNHVIVDRNEWSRARQRRARQRRGNR